MRATATVLGLVATPILHGLSFPTAGLGALAWIAFVPWFVAVRLARTGTALVLSAAITLAGSALVASWLPRAASVYYGRPLWLGIVCLLGVWAVTVAPWVLAFTLCYRAFGRRAGMSTPLLAAAAWTGAELARVRLFVGDPFGLLGYSQANATPVVQIAEVTGVYGVGFVVAAVNAALAELWLAGRRGRPRRPALAGAGLVLATVVLVVVFGVVRVRALDGALATAPVTRVAVAQANLDLGAQWRTELYGRNFDAYVRLTATLRGAEPPALVVWPESAMTFFLEDERLYRRALGRLLAPGRLQLLAGGPSTDGNGRYRNSAFLVAPDGEVVARYDKERLLPFAEYFPLASVELLRREFARVREFTPGTPTPPLPTVAGRAGVLVCNEAMFPEIARARARAGAEVLVALTNDSWLGGGQFAEQSLDMARLRAVEQRRWLVRASTSGPSALVDPLGRVVARTDAARAATLAGAVGRDAALTPYARVGDAAGALAAAVAVLAAVRRWREGRAR